MTDEMELLKVLEARATVLESSNAKLKELISHLQDQSKKHQLTREHLQSLCDNLLETNDILISRIDTLESAISAPRRPLAAPRGEH
jgi:hypothetical protein